jgi:hypothetical protein
LYQSSVTHPYSPLTGWRLSGQWIRGCFLIEAETVGCEMFYGWSREQLVQECAARNLKSRTRAQAEGSTGTWGSEKTPLWLQHIGECEDTAQLIALLRDGVNVEWVDKQHQTWTPLGWAIWQFRETAVDWLLEHGASVEQVAFARHPMSRCTPLGWALVVYDKKIHDEVAQSVEANKLVAIVTALIHHGASVRTPFTYGDEHTPESHSSKLLGKAKRRGCLKAVVTIIGLRKFRCTAMQSNGKDVVLLIASMIWASRR